jgi:hypothetical protein
MKKLIRAFIPVGIIILSGCSILEQPPVPLPQTTKKTTVSPKNLYNKKEKLSLHVDVRHLLSLQNRKQLEKYIQVVDQNGKKVTHIQVIDGQVSIFTPLTSKILDLKYNESEIPLSVVIYQVCSILQHDILKSKKQDSLDKEDLIIEEISWDEYSNALSFLFSGLQK